MILELRNAANPNQLITQWNPWPFAAMPRVGERVWWPGRHPQHGHVTAVEWDTIAQPAKVVVLVTP